MTAIRYFRTGDGCRVAYRWEGAEGLPVLVLSNSIATNLSMWDRQVAELARSFRVLRYDFRGHGGSDVPVGAYSLDRLGRDVLEMLDSLQVARVHFCGLSLGGFVGQWLGIHAPERIERLILSNTSSHLEPVAYFDEQIRRVLAAKDMLDTAELFMKNWFPGSMLAGRNEAVAEFRAMVRATAPVGLAGCFAAVRDSDLRRTISLITAPTLVIGGEEDKVTLASHSEAITAAIPGARLLLLPGVHMLNVERPAEFMSAVMGFLVGG
jgi:3-oxoadipate enol-lactonase